MEIKDCVLLNIATGVRAQNLKELRKGIETIDADSIYYHFWGKKLRPGFGDSEYHNDFADWAYNKLHNNKLAEKLSLINPGTLSDIEALRAKLLEVTDLVLKENQSLENSKENEKFQFSQSDTVLFDTEFKISKPEELSKLFPSLTLGSIYYHFINTDSLVAFITNSGEEYSSLGSQLSNIDPYFFTLAELKEKLSQLFHNFFEGGNR